MKCYSKILLVIALVLFNQFGYSQNFKTKVSTVAELKVMASKYNIEDIVSDTLNTALQYATKEHADRFFKEQYEVRETIKETDLYLERTKNVRTIADRIALVNSLPRFKRLEIQSCGGEDKWNAENQKFLKGSYRIYRGTTGGLAILPSKFNYTPEQEKMIGKRLDNLPKE